MDTVLREAHVVELYERWCALWQGEKGYAADACFEKLQELYCSEERHYHTFEHIFESLRSLDQFESLLRFKRTVEVAIWFHDAIYDTHADDNEERSADLAEYWLAELGELPDFINFVRHRILATKHDGSLDVSYHDDERLIADIDLLPLAYVPKEFDRLSECIRREYRWMTEDAYNKKQSAFLRKFLSPKPIYYTQQIRMIFEKRARKNIFRAITKMK